jgi:hypothetical protein
LKSDFEIQIISYIYYGKLKTLELNLLFRFKNKVFIISRRSNKI